MASKYDDTAQAISQKNWQNIPNDENDIPWPSGVLKIYISMMSRDPQSVVGNI